MYQREKSPPLSVNGVYGDKLAATKKRSARELIEEASTAVSMLQEEVAAIKVRLQEAQGELTRMQAIAFLVNEPTTEAALA